MKNKKDKKECEEQECEYEDCEENKALTDLLGGALFTLSLLIFLGWALFFAVLIQYS